MSAPAVRYVRDMSFDNRTFAAALVDSAVRGHAKLVDAGGERMVEQRKGAKPLPCGRTGHGVEAVHGMARVKLAQSNHVRIAGAKDALSQRLAKDYAPLIVPNTAWAVWGRVCQHRHPRCRRVGERGDARQRSGAGRLRLP